MKSNDKDFNVDHDKWVYTNTNHNSRKLSKKLRNKAIRREVQKFNNSSFFED